ncbi:MAG: hypothetical protein II608_03225 [Oscillospiraceae bacterium]|nr:hypothetical protein [Oscillospiraceae bacterium]
MPVSEAQLRATAKYKAEHYDVVKVNFPKGKKEEIRVHAESRGESLNAFVQRSVRETLARDNETPEA